MPCPDGYSNIGPPTTLDKILTVVCGVPMMIVLGGLAVVAMVAPLVFLGMFAAIAFERLF